MVYGRGGERPASGPYTAREAISTGPQCNTIFIFYIFIYAYMNKKKNQEKIYIARH